MGDSPLLHLPETLEAPQSLHRASDCDTYFEKIEQWKIYIRFGNWKVHTRCASQCDILNIALVANINKPIKQEPRMYKLRN